MKYQLHEYYLFVFFFLNLEHANELPFIVNIPQIRSTVKIDTKSSQWFFSWCQYVTVINGIFLFLLFFFLFKWQSTLSMLNSNEDYQYVPWGQKRLSQCFTHKKKRNSENKNTDKSKMVLCNAFLGCKSINFGWLNFFQSIKVKSLTKNHISTSG